MTKILLSPLISEARGKMGSIVFSKNRNGHYVRGDKTHINVDALRAAGLVGIFRDLSLYWKNTLTDIQRIRWNQYAKKTPLSNSLGQTYFITGINAFVKTNLILRIISGLTYVDPPTMSGQGKALILNQSGFSISAFSQLFTISASSDIIGWDNITPFDYVIIYIGTAQTSGTNFFKQPYKIFSWIEGSLIPPVFPIILPMPYVVLQEEKVWFSFQHLEPSGAISKRSICVVTVGP